MSEIVPVLRGISAPEDRWEDSTAVGLGALDGLAYRSNLLGADRAIANQGGGNTSAKETTADHLGRDGRVLWVKGSGTDLATIAPAGFAGLRLDELLPLRAATGWTTRRWWTTCAVARSALTSLGRRSRRSSTHSSPRSTSTTRIRTP